jgi:hypothetical protein
VDTLSARPEGHAERAAPGVSGGRDGTGPGGLAVEALLGVRVAVALVDGVLPVRAHGTRQDDRTGRITPDAEQVLRRMVALVI